ncbi:MAG: type I restriction endonuclease, partial [Daejeonella sp.]
GKPIILIECKHYSENLDPHNSQLFRYFHTTEAKFGLLTNGITFRFYTDLVTPNKMDEKPFYEFNIQEIKDNEITELKKFHKSYFDLENITNTASELKYLNEIKSLLAAEMQNPSEDFVRYFAKKAYPSIVTAKVLEQFNGITKKAFSLLISDIINDRLKTALKTENANEEPLTDIQTSENSDKSLVSTSEEEVEAHMIIKSILRKKIETKKITMRDAQSYCTIIFDDNNRKPICRLYLDGKRKFIEIPDENRKFIKAEITCLEDIFNYDEELFKIATSYLKP